MSKEGTKLDEDEMVRIAGVSTDNASRRGVLRTAASALAGGSLLAGAAADAGATPHDGGQLDVRTTNVEVLDQPTENGNGGKLRTTGEISGMSNFDTNKCEVGAQVQPVGHDRWFGGLQTIRHAPGDSIRVAITLSGLTPGRFRCRLCACPSTMDDVFVANVLIVIIEAVDRDRDHHEKKDHHEKQKHHKKKKDYHKKEHHKGKKKFRKAHRKTCPCSLHHPDRYHLLICGGGPNTVHDYAFQSSSRDIQRVGVSAAPNAIADRYVTIDTEDAVRGNIVTGAVAGGGDSYVCGGYLTDVRTDRGASVYLNGMDVTDAVY